MEFDDTDSNNEGGVDKAPPPEAPMMEDVAVPNSTSGKKELKAPLFRFMARMPYPFLVVLPVVFIFLIAFGFSQEDIVEEHVANLWIPQEGSLGRNKEYMESIGKTEFDSSTFAAMAIGRDGKNILRQDRLEEIRQRMEDVDAITVEYNGNTYGWADLCASTAAPYELPCARLTALDIFRESQWEWNELEKSEWYQSVIFKLLIRPRIPRFGVMTTNCVTPPGTIPETPAVCDALVLLRTNPAMLGPPYDDLEPQPLRLFADIGNMELNDPCRMCIDGGYETTIQGLHASIIPTFGVLSQELQRYSATLTDDAEKQAMVNGILAKTSQLATTITRDDVEDFYFYYVTRSVYSELGWTGYIEGYQALVGACNAFGFPACPPADVTEEEAKAAMLAHADNTFSSVTTAGAPFPFWSEGDGTGFLFGGGLAPGANGPVSGSGIDMSAELSSLGQDYLDLPNFQTPSSRNPAYGRGGFADPESEEWMELVDKNPIYAWFIAGLTEAEPGTVCGNGNLTGTNFGDPDGLDKTTAALMGDNSQYWCTPFDLPNDLSTMGDDGDEAMSYSQQHFARMWYDLLINSPRFLGLTQGTDDPYTWTSGQGCGYNLGGERYTYTDESEENILGNASREIYYIDEGESVGVVDPNLLIGGVTPPIGSYSYENPLQEVTVIQTLYASLTQEGIVERVKNCKRPGGGIDISEEDAEEILKDFKELFDDTWSKGWDNEDAGQLQFVNFVDDSGAIGSAGRMLRQITLDNSKFMAVSIIIIAVFSALFIFSFDWIESRVLVTLIGVALVILSFFAAVGFGILVGIKVNVSIAWTLPFIIMGLGVDDVYIVLTSLRKAGGYEEKHWLEAMKDVVVPVTMTSLVNVCMMAVLNVSDIPAVYLTAQVAAYSIIALYLSVILAFPAYCLLDFQRQQAGRLDVLFCFKSKNAGGPRPEDDFRSVILYDKIYRPLMLGARNTRIISHVLVWAGSIALIAIGAYGISEREVGLGLEDFFPSDNQAGRWATFRTEEMASWSVGMNWGALNYEHPYTQMKMIKQFEDVVATPHMSEVDTKRLWMADFLLWTTRMCTDNFDREDFDSMECGRDVFHAETNSTCSGIWTENIFNLRQKSFTNLFDTTQACVAYEEGICRPTEQMHPLDMAEAGIQPGDSRSWCPVVNAWPDTKWQYCLREWRNITGFGGGRFLFEEGTGTRKEDCPSVMNKDEEFQWPIPYTAGPTMFSFDLNSHEITLDMMEETRAICDDDEELHCWMTGIPFNYWTQYENIDKVLLELCGYSVAVGFGIAFIFLVGTFIKKRYTDPSYAERHATSSVVAGSLIGALLIAVTIVASVVSVVGLSILADVNLTGFSNMAFVLSVGFSTEYSVHVVDRWLLADLSFQSSLDRTRHAMELLMLPTFMSFISSTIGVVTIAFTEFDFTQVFFFRPLIITVVVTYWFGCWWLPALLSILDFDAVKLGDNAPEGAEEQIIDKVPVYCKGAAVVVAPEEAPPESAVLPPPQEEQETSKPPSVMQDSDSMIEVDC